MTSGKILSLILIMFSGLSVFMFGLKTMSERLEKQAGNGLRKLFGKASNNKFIGVGIGAGVTAIIQSSSATTVMVVGLVNAGILTLTQATAMIMGANIGTTVTAVLISLPITEIVASSGLIGVFLLMFSQKTKVRNTGYIIIGLSMIFTGLFLMSSSMKQFSSLDSIRRFFSATSNPFLLILIGAIFTAIIQSSSATTGILITLSSVGLMTVQSAMFVVLGINIGTCITAILACIGASANAKRTAAIHLIFNIVGATIFAVALSFSFIRNGVLDVLYRIGSSLPSNGLGSQIAAFHIFFNVLTTLLLLPFASLMVRFSLLLFSDKKQSQNEYVLEYLNDLMLKSTSMALVHAKSEILRMAEMAKYNLELAMDAIININMKNLEDFEKREKYIDWLNREIPFFLAKLSSKHINFEDEKTISSFYHAIIDIERIGDYAENIFEYAERMHKEQLKFSEDALKEISSMYQKMQKLYNLSISGFELLDMSLSKEIDMLEDLIDKYKVNLSEKHIKRLGDGVCIASSGAIFLSLVSNLERVSDHIRNIFNSVRPSENQNKKS